MTLVLVTVGVHEITWFTLTKTPVELRQVLPALVTKDTGSTGYIQNYSVTI